MNFLSKTVAHKFRQTQIIVDSELPEFTLGKRSNRYYKAPVDWDKYSYELELAGQGTRENPKKVYKSNCGKVKYFFAGKDKSGKIKIAMHKCNKMGCRVCGLITAHRNAVRMALRILRLKNCGWNKIRFLSMNIDTRLEKFRRLPNESYRIWFNRTEKIVVKDAKESGMIGFYQVFHIDRLKQKSVVDTSDIRRPHEHFHIIGIGKMLDSAEFYLKYGYTYTMQKSTDFRKKSELIYLVSRIAYRLNHCAYFHGKKRSSNAYKCYGLLSNGNSKTLNSETIETPILTEGGNEYIAWDLEKYASSDKPKRVRNKLVILKNRMNQFIEKSGYPLIKDEHEYKNLNSAVYDKNLKVDDSWRSDNRLEYKKDYKNNLILLKEVETILEVQVKGFQKHVISSNMLKKGKDFNTDIFGVSNESITRVHNKFKQLQIKRKELN